MIDQLISAADQLSSCCARCGPGILNQWYYNVTCTTLPLLFLPLTNGMVGLSTTAQEKEERRRREGEREENNSLLESPLLFTRRWLASAVFTSAAAVPAAALCA